MVKPKAQQNRKCDRHIFRAARASCMPVLVPRARRSLGTFQKPKSLFWAPPVYKDLSTRYDWPVKNATVDLSASQTESVRLKDRRQQRGNVHALFLLPCRLSVTRDHVFGDMWVTYQGKLFYVPVTTPRSRSGLVPITPFACFSLVLCSPLNLVPRVLSCSPLV